MNDHLNGLVGGVGMALYLAEKNRKTPKRIEPLLAALIRDLATVAGNDQLEHVNFDIEYNRKHGAPYPRR